jgi:hypothetical protein
MNKADIEQMARKIFADKFERQEGIEMEQAVEELMSLGGEISGEGVEFYRVCAYDCCWRTIKKAFPKYQPRASEVEQLDFPEFKHLQAYYPVERDGNRMAVSLNDMSDDEISERIQEYRSQGSGCLEHADELQRYLALRKSGQV